MQQHETFKPQKTSNPCVQMCTNCKWEDESLQQNESYLLNWQIPRSKSCLNATPEPIECYEGCTRMHFNSEVRTWRVCPNLDLFSAPLFKPYLVWSRIWNFSLCKHQMKTGGKTDMEGQQEQRYGFLSCSDTDWVEGWRPEKRKNEG